MSEHLNAMKVRRLLAVRDSNAKLRIRLGSRKYSLGWAHSFNPEGVPDQDLVLSVDEVHDNPKIDPLVGAGWSELDNELSKMMVKQRVSAKLWIEEGGKLYHVTGVTKHKDTVTMQTEQFVPELHVEEPEPCRACGVWQCLDCPGRRQRANRYKAQKCPRCHSTNGQMNPILHRTEETREDHGWWIGHQTERDIAPVYPLEIKQGTEQA